VSLILITGRANAGKTEIAYDLLRDSLRSGETPFLLVPSQPDAERAADDLAGSFSLGVRVMTFDRYLAQSWATHGDGRTVVTPGQRMMLLSDAARRVEGASRGIVRLADRCAATIVDQVGVSWRRASGVVEGPGAVLAEVLRAYREALQALNLVELSEASYLLSERGASSADLVVAHRFTDFTPSQENFLLGAAASGVRTAVTLTWEQGFAPTEALDGLVARLAPLADSHQRLAFEDEPGTSPELRHLERELFMPLSSLDPQGAIRLSFAEGPEAEAVRIAQEVRRLIEEDNVSAEEIAVVFRDPDGHSQFIREAFADADIPADFDVRVPFGSTPFGRAFLGILAFAIQGDRAGLLSFLRSRFSGADRDRVADAEATWRRRGLSSPRGLASEASLLGECTRKNMIAAQRCASRDVDVATAAAWHYLADRLLVTGYGRQGRALSGAYESDAWAHAAVTETLTDIVELGRVRLAPADLIDALTARKLAPTEVERKGRVQVTAVARVRARRFRALVLGGLNTGEFPASSTEDMLPQGAVAHVLSAFGGSGQEKLGAPFERLLFYQTITRPTKSLVLSSCTTDSDGEILQVSPLLEEVLDFYRDEDGLRLEPVRRRMVEIPAPGDSCTPREALRALAYRADEGNPRAAAALSRTKSRDGELGEEARALLAIRDTFSASELESYLSCPYRWFYERALRPQRLDTEFDEAQQGSFAHDVLRAFYDRFLEQTTETRIDSSSLPLALEILSLVYDEECESAGLAGSMSEEMARREVLRWTRRVVAEDAGILPGFAPTRFEWDFSAEAVDVGGFKLKGRVDRIDEDASGRAIVTDYKRSNAASAADMLKYGKIQLPLYLRAVELRLELKPAGGLYRALRTSSNRGLIDSDMVVDPTLGKNDFLPTEEFSLRIESAVELARGAAEGIRQALIPRAPLVVKSCDTCPASRVCGGRA